MEKMKRTIALVLLLALTASLIPAESLAIGLIKSNVTISVTATDKSAKRAVIGTSISNPSNNNIKTVEYTLFNSAGKKLETVSRSVGQNSTSITLSFNTKEFKTSLSPNTTYSVEVNLILKGLYRDVTKKLSFTTGTELGITVKADSYHAALNTGIKVSFAIKNPSKNRIKAVSIKVNGELQSSSVTLNKSDATVTASLSRSGYGGGKTVAGTATVTMATGESYSRTFSVKTLESYENKITKFLNDSRWRKGTSWGKSTKSKLGGNWYQCAAYAYDFSKYVFNKNPNSSGKDKPISIDSGTTKNIRRGDVIKINYSGGVHWFVVLERSGNSLTTADANWPVNGKRQVRIGDDNFVIEGNRIRVMKLKNGSSLSTSLKVFHLYKK